MENHEAVKAASEQQQWATDAHWDVWIGTLQEVAFKHFGKGRKQNYKTQEYEELLARPDTYLRTSAMRALSSQVLDWTNSMT